MNGESKFPKWITAALVILSWIALVAVQWGAFASRISAVEDSNKSKVDQKVYDEGQRDIRERLTRIEDKIDKQAEKRR